MRKIEAARAALEAHDALRATRDTEPPSDEETGMPVDADAWIAWSRDVSEPAYAAWTQAMDELDAALGETVGRHPFTFRPICEQIVDET